MTIMAKAANAVNLRNKIRFYLIVHTCLQVCVQIANKLHGNVLTYRKLSFG